jgi:hypothetical protein
MVKDHSREQDKRTTRQITTAENEVTERIRFRRPPHLEEYGPDERGEGDIYPAESNDTKNELFRLSIVTNLQVARHCQDPLLCILIYNPLD